MRLARPTRFERVASTFGGQRSIYAARRGMALSTNRKNLVLRAPATALLCDAVPPVYDAVLILAAIEGAADASASAFAISRR